MLESLRLIDFKSFVDETIPFAPVTYLLGASSAGKSNSLDALRFLRALPFQGPQAPFLEGMSHGLDATEVIRGGAQKTARFGANGFAIHSAWTFSDGPGRRSAIGHSVRCQVAPTLRLLDERITGERGEVIASSPRVSGEVSGAADTSILDVAQVSSHPCAERLSLALALLTFIDVHPEQMRRPNPGDWSSVWYRIAHHRRAGARQRFDTFVEWANEASGSMLHALDFLEDEQGVTIVLVERDGCRVSARSMSDGLLRCLGIFTALLTAKPGTVVCLDAPAAGLHPRQARLLVELFERAYHDRRIQVVATVQDASLLRWLDDEHLARVVLLARTPDHPGTMARRLGDLPGFFGAVRTLGLEEMLATQWLEASL